MPPRRRRSERWSENGRSYRPRRRNHEKAQSVREWHQWHLQHHLIAEGGYTTRLELQAKLPEDLVADLVDEIQGDYAGIIAYFRDPKTGKEHTLTEGDQGKPRRLRHLYATRATAKRAVEREWQKFKEGA